MKRFHRSYLLIFIFLAVISVACSHDRQAGVETNRFRVALMVPGPTSDAGWNAAAFAGLEKIAHTLNAETALVQTTSPADFEDAFRDFASRGFELIFANGFEYTDSALRMGKVFPQTTFAVNGGNGSSANVVSINFRLEDGAYIEGVLSGLMTRSGVVGAIGGIELPTVKIMFDAYRAGLIASRPDARMVTSYIGNFNDVGAAKEAALAQISRGADLLIHDADAAGLGVLQAAAERKVYAFGVIGNQNDLAPSAVLASAVSDIPDAFDEIATKVREHHLVPGVIVFGMKDGMVKVVFNPRLLGRISPAVMAQVTAAEKNVIAGKVQVPSLTPPADLSPSGSGSVSNSQSPT